MKQVYTLLISALGVSGINAQAIFNEIYAIPGNARQEFFEFYNNSTNPTSMDNYTIVTYFEDGGQSGFYVLDLPNLSVGPLGYFVGSASIPFDYQQVKNSTASQFSWNDAAFLAANNGYLRKWVLSSTVATDGNPSYDLAPVPANFNDFFNRIGGGNASYNVFIYNNGLLQSIFLGGTGGNTFLPDYIINLPSLQVDMSGTSPDFTIDFSSYSTVNPEFVTQEAGSDNGYIRLRDGFCGTWDKSDNGASHSPGATNPANAGIVPEVSVMSSIVRGTAATGSVVNYNVVAGPTNEFPVILHVYIDNGTVPGQLDAGDTHLVDKTETVVTDGPFSTVFFPYTANIIIQTTTSAGCIDNLLTVLNAGVLPVRLTSFQGNKSDQSNILTWTVSENESGKAFEVQKSTDGKSFTTIAVVSSTHNAGIESYKFNDPAAITKTYYRIKLVDKSGQSFYSGIVAIENKSLASNAIRIVQNPVESYLSFTYAAAAGSMATVNIYNISGTKVYSQKINLSQGPNTIAIPVDGKIYTGAYVLEVINDVENNRTKFIKR